MSSSKNYGLGGVGSNIELGKGGIRLINNGSVMEARNQANSAYVALRVAEPTEGVMAATKAYVDKLAAVFVKAQMKNDVARLPDDSGAFVPTTGDIIIVTTVGTTWDTLKTLLKYNGATWEYLFAGGTTPEGLRMSVTDSISGGTDTYTGDHVYVWDEDGTVWVDVGPAAASVDVTYGYTVPLADDSAATVAIKATATGRAVRVIVNVTAAFDGTAPTLTIGDAGDNDRLMTTGEIDLKTIGLYVAECYYAYSGVTINGYYVADSSVNGDATITVQVIN